MQTLLFTPGEPHHPFPRLLRQHLWKCHCFHLSLLHFAGVHSQGNSHSNPLNMWVRGCHHLWAGNLAKAPCLEWSGTNQCPHGGLLGPIGPGPLAHQVSSALPELLCSTHSLGFPGGSDGKESACNSGDLSLIPGSGRSPGEGNDNPLQYSCLENSMDRGAWWATVHGVAKSHHDWATNTQPHPHPHPHTFFTLQCSQEELTSTDSLRTLNYFFSLKHCFYWYAPTPPQHSCSPYPALCFLLPLIPSTN